jgi:multiple sugar transport system ATP-binding protein
MVFQDYALYPHLTVYENMAFPLRLRHASGDEIKGRVERMAEMLELSDFLDRKPANLSGGQRQRVAMGRAMVRDAHAFLFDEPLSNLDAKLRTQMRTEISRLQAEFGSTTVYVTHDQVEAMTLGDRLALLRQGAIQQVGTPRELYEQPVNLFVAGFIGAPPMNFLPADIRADSLRTPFGDVPFDTGPLRGRLGDTDVLIAGIRPEQFQDPTLLDDDQRRRKVVHRARVDVIEWLGDEQLVYLPYEAPEHIQRQLTDLGKELDAEWSRTQVVAKLSAETRVAEGEEVELAFDPADLHLFDPATGNNLAYEPESAAQ